MNWLFNRTGGGGSHGSLATIKLPGPAATRGKLFLITEERLKLSIKILRVVSLGHETLDYNCKLVEKLQK